MREIKFRAWDEVIKMVTYSPVIAESAIDGLAHTHLNYWLKDNELYRFMQYTGLKDKNGVEIYEGDVIESGEIGMVQLVKWGDIANDHPDDDYILGVGFELFDPHSKPNTYKVIGNIYENPELLK